MSTPQNAQSRTPGGEAFRRALAEAAPPLGVGTVITIGVFDGVHRGHRHVKPFLDTILDLRSYRGAYSSVYAMESSSPAPSGRRARTQSFRPLNETTAFGSQL